MVGIYFFLIFIVKYIKNFRNSERDNKRFLKGFRKKVNWFGILGLEEYSIKLFYIF